MIKSEMSGIRLGENTRYQASFTCEVPAIDVHDLYWRAAPLDLRQFLIAVVIGNLCPGHVKTYTNAFDVFLEQGTEIRVIGQLFAIADMQVHPGAAPNEVIKYIELLAEKFRILVQPANDMPRRLSEPWAKLDRLPVPPISSADIFVVSGFLFRNHARHCNRIELSCPLHPWRLVLHKVSLERRLASRSSTVGNEPAGKPDLPNAVF